MINASKILTSNQRFALSIFLPSLYLVPLVVAYFSPKDFGFGQRWLTQIGLSIGLIGTGLWITSMLQLGTSLAVMPGTKELIMRGIYKYCVHPMYLGISLTIFGLMLACGSVIGLVYLLGVILPVNTIRARLEEKTLTNQFGELYLNYKKSTLF